MHITIAGDSWGYYWDKQGQQQQALEKVLTEKGHSVLNLTVPGSCNRRTVRRIISSIVKTDMILFIQTEPIREWFTKEASVDLSGHPRSVVDAEKLFAAAEAAGSVETVLKNQLKDETYCHLSQWQKQTSTPILMIGGCSYVDPDLVPDNLICAVPSWPLLLFGADSYQETIFIDTAQWLSWEYSDLIHQRKNIDLMIEWYDITKRIMVKTTVWLNDQTYFNPDNWHPNYQGQEKLDEYIEPYFQRYK